MKKIIIPIICLCLLLSGCGVHWSYATMIKAIDNDYFKTKIIHEDSECIIIQNKVTGEYFLVVSGTYGMSICPIQVGEKEVFKLGSDGEKYFLIDGELYPINEEDL